MNKLSLGGPGSTMPSSNSTIQTGGSTIYSSDAGVTSTAPTTRSGGWAKVPAVSLLFGNKMGEVEC